MVVDRTTRGTGQDIMEGFYEGFSCLKGDCLRRRRVKEWGMRKRAKSKEQRARRLGQGYSVRARVQG